jgi:hypothetical protein
MTTWGPVYFSWTEQLYLFGKYIYSCAFYVPGSVIYAKETKTVPDIKLLIYYAEGRQVNQQSSLFLNTLQKYFLSAVLIDSIT